MKNIINQGTLTLYFEGELNSYNADNIEKDIEATLQGQDFKALVLDFSNLTTFKSSKLLWKFMTFYP